MPPLATMATRSDPFSTISRIAFAQRFTAAGFLEAAAGMCSRKQELPGWRGLRSPIHRLRRTSGRGQRLLRIDHVETGNRPACRAVPRQEGASPVRNRGPANEALQVFPAMIAKGGNGGREKTFPGDRCRSARSRHRASFRRVFCPIRAWLRDVGIEAGQGVLPLEDV